MDSLPRQQSTNNNDEGGMHFEPTTQQVSVSSIETKKSSSSSSKSNNKKTQMAGKNYEIKKMLGQSYICRVHLACDVRDQKTYALKSYPKKLIQAEQKLETLRREVKILQKVRHRYIQSLREVVLGESHFYIVVEFVSSILSDKIIDSPNHRLPEDVSRKYFQKIIVALRHCHRKGVVHRDLKCDKVLIEDETGDIKLTGFDVSEFQKEGELLPTCFTTFANSAPEVLAGEEYDGFSADIFSVVSSVLFPMLFGVHPFESPKKSLMFNNIENCEYSFPNNITEEDVSDEAKDLIDKVLVVDPDERLSIEQIIQHPWFVTGFDPSELEWQRESAGIKRAESSLEDTEELNKLNFDISGSSEPEGNNQNDNNNNNNNNVMLRRESSSFSADIVDSLLQKFPPNFIFSSSDIQIVASPIGKGGSGSVFKAKIASVGWDVAVKLFRERDNIERAILECEQSLKLRHRNLVQTVGLAVAKSAFSIDLVMLMELGEKSLDTVLFEARENIKNGKNMFSFDQAWSYGKQIAEALAYLHSRKERILHLDVKPSNIILSQNSTCAKLCDLGISRICGVDKQNIDVTRAGVGTLRYCSQEQLTSRKLDARCDVYSYGATLFAMIDEHFEPWHERTVAEISQRSITLMETLKPRDGCPAKLIDICKRCVEPDLEKRPKDATEVFKMFLEPGEKLPDFIIAYENRMMREQNSNNNNNDDDGSSLSPSGSMGQPVATSLDELLLHQYAGIATSSSSEGSSAMNTFTLRTDDSVNSKNDTGAVSLSGEKTETFEATQNWTYN